ncbi:restriction endonuclease subunit S [Microvirga sp. TS319]|uniref:restriction endonuclease subunit S n=1 Tax=Microvirga sp. TS319 TaxID=3241165 RepID=UPI00351A5F6A
MKWPTIPLGELVKVRGGGTPKRNNPSFFRGDIPWVTPKDMKSWDIKDAQIKITQEAIENSAANLLPANTVLLVVRSGVLKHTAPVAINRIPVAINQDMKSLECSRHILPEFLARFLKSSEPIILSWVRATTADNYPIDNLKELEIPLPPLDEQRRIAAILDQADALRHAQNVALTKLSSLKQAIFLEMFGDPVQNRQRWQRVPLGELLSGIESGWSPTCLDRPARSEEWGVLKLSAVTSCAFNDNEHKALPDSVEPRPSIEVRPGDVLFTRKNTYDLVAACALVRATRSRLMLSDLIFRLRIADLGILVPDYLQALLAYPTKRKEVQRLAGGSAGSMPNISKERLRGVDIELPPLQLQQAFAEKVSYVEELFAAQQSQFAQLDTLFASLQHRAFRGEL